MLCAAERLAGAAAEMAATPNMCRPGCAVPAWEVALHEAREALMDLWDELVRPRRYGSFINADIYFSFIFLKANGGPVAAVQHCTALRGGRALLYRLAARPTRACCCSTSHHSTGLIGLAAHG